MGAATEKSLTEFLSRGLEKIQRKQWLTPYFEQALLTANWPEEYAIHIHNKERHFDGMFHPSSHTSPEALYLYYYFHPDFHTEQERLSPQSVMTFQVGHAYHALVQSLFIHLGFTTEEECEVGFVSEKRHASGTLDVRKLWLPDGKEFPVEIKSAGFIPKQPYVNHVQQLQVYMDLGYGDEPAESGIIFYVEKQSPHRTAEFIVHRDEAILNEIYAKWERVLEAIAFNDPDSLRLCCMGPTSKDFRSCRARFVCHAYKDQA